MNIREAHEKLATDEQCLQYIRQMCWPDGVMRCPYRHPRRQEWVHEESFPFVDDFTLSIDGSPSRSNTLNSRCESLIWPEGIPD